MEKFLISVLMACFIVAVNSESSLKEAFSKYRFHFKTGDTGEHMRTEESDESGRVIGMYSYKDPNGVLRTIRYNAAPESGYQAYGDGIPQFGYLPEEYLNNVTPTNLPVAQLNTEDKNNDTNELYTSAEYEAQESEVTTVTDLPTNDSTATTLATKILSEIESESSGESSTISPEMNNNNKIFPVLLPYGSFHRVLIHSGHLYYPVPHALAYSLVAPNYQMVL